MNLVAGHIVDIITKDGMRIAKVQLQAEIVCAALKFASDVTIGDTVLIDSGIAIAKIQNRIEEED